MKSLIYSLVFILISVLNLTQCFALEREVNLEFLAYSGSMDGYPGISISIKRNGQVNATLVKSLNKLNFSRKAADNVTIEKQNLFTLTTLEINELSSAIAEIPIPVMHQSPHLAQPYG